MFGASTIGRAFVCALREPIPMLALPVGSRFPSTATDCQPLRLLMGSLYQGACQGVRASGLALRREMLYLVLVLSLLSPEGGVD